MTQKNKSFMFYNDLLILDQFKMKVTILFVLYIVGNEFKIILGYGTIPVQTLVTGHKVCSCKICTFSTENNMDKIFCQKLPKNAEDVDILVQFLEANHS